MLFWSSSVVLRLTLVSASLSSPMAYRHWMYCRAGKQQDVEQLLSHEVRR